MDPTTRRGPVRWRQHTVWLLFALTVPACSLPRSPTMWAVPPEWRHGNPFGPEANAARAAGLLHVYGHIRRAAEWTAFAHAYIQTGDILFRRGHSSTLLGNLTSRVLAGVNDGRFSHEALAHWEGDQLWVYDVETEGARSVPFEIWMLDTYGDAFAVKRLRPEYRHCIPQAVAFCEAAYQRHAGFNFKFKAVDKSFYCSEMVEKGYRSAGLHLSEPIPIKRMPGFQHYRFLVPAIQLYTGIDPNTPVFALGNEHYGTFASPYLELVYEGPEADKPERGVPLPPAADAEEPTTAALNE